MAENRDELLERLIVVSDVDSNIARIDAETKQLNEELEEKRGLLSKSISAHEDATLALHQTKSVYEREQRFIKSEQGKLVDRRKALSASGSDYKTQMAAEREIEHSSRQLIEQDDKLVELLEKTESLEKLEKEAKEARDNVQKEFSEKETEVRATIQSFEGRLSEYKSKRAESVKGIDPRSLQTYNRVWNRYPMDAVVGVKSNTCQGCFLELGPQIIVQIGRGDSLIRCRGCGRILFIDNSEEE